MKIKAVLAAIVIGGLLLIGAPSVSQAVNITSVTVDIPGSQFAGAFTLAGWGPFPVVLNPGDALILTQTNATPFNFDTSDLSCRPCSPTATVTVNGVVFTDTGKVLTFNGADTALPSTNEAHEFASTSGASALIAVFVGYADTAHTDNCADTSGNCTPDPFASGPGVIFRGAGTPTTPGQGCDRPGITTCFDSGVIEIIALRPPVVPEPSSLLLLGVGLVGVAMWPLRKRLIS